MNNESKAVSPLPPEEPINQDASLDAAMTLADRGFFSPNQVMERGNILLTSVRDLQCHQQHRGTRGPKNLYLGHDEVNILDDYVRATMAIVPNGELRARRMILGMEVFVVDAKNHIAVSEEAQ